MYSDFRERNDMTAEERREMFSKEVLTAEDIAKLFDCSRTTAYTIIRNIKLRYNRLNDKMPGKDGGTTSIRPLWIQGTDK